MYNHSLRSERLSSKWTAKVRRRSRSFYRSRRTDMEYRKLGRSGVLVSPLCLGAMNFGGPTNEADSCAIMQRAVEAGINFFDTANVYNKGESERIVGKFLKDKN